MKVKDRVKYNDPERGWIHGFITSVNDDVLDWRYLGKIGKVSAQFNTGRGNLHITIPIKRNFEGFVIDDEYEKLTAEKKKSVMLIDPYGEENWEDDVQIPYWVSENNDIGRAIE